MATVVIVTPYPVPSQRLHPDPDLATGHTIEWANVMGGVEADVQVLDDGRFSSEPAVTAFDWRVNDGVEWGAWATQTIVDATNTYEYSLDSAIQTGTSLGGETGTMNQNEYSLDSAIQVTAGSGVDFGVGAFNQYEYSLTAVLVTAYSSSEDVGTLNQNEYSLVSGLVSGTALDGDAGGVALNEYEYTLTSSILGVSSMTYSQGVAEVHPFMNSILLIRPPEFDPAEASRFLKRNPRMLGVFLPGSSNQIQIQLLVEDAGVEADADLTDVTRIRLRLGSRYLLDQQANVSPEHLEWLPTGEVYINPQSLLAADYSPGTYRMQLEVFVAENDFYVFPSDADCYLTIPRPA